MKKAKVDVVNISIFSWSTLELKHGEYSFYHLHRIIDLLSTNGNGVDLRMAIASPPTWVTRPFPAMLPVAKDGKTMTHGSQQYCPDQWNHTM
jgi:beta-galactosidase